MSKSYFQALQAYRLAVAGRADPSAAQDRLARAARPLTCRFLRYKDSTLSPADVEDIASETLLCLFRDVHKCTAGTERSARGWLFQIADRRRLDHRHHSTQDAAKTLAFAREVAEPHGPPSTNLHCQRITARLDELKEAIALGASHVARHKEPADLAERGCGKISRNFENMRHRIEVLLARFLDETEPSELAERYGATSATINNWVSRARTITRIGLEARRRGYPPVEDPSLLALIQILDGTRILEDGC